MKFTAPAIRVRCIGIHGFSPWVFELAVIVLGTLAVFPIVSALRLSGVSASNPIVSTAKRYFISVPAGAAVKRDIRPAIEVCEDLADGVDRLRAEFSVSYLTPQSERDISNLYVLTDLQNDRNLLPETTALAARARAMIKDYFELAASDTQNSEIRRAMLINSLTSSIGDLSIAVRRDCKTVTTPALPQQPVYTAR